MEDIISAIATPRGRGGVAIIRVSGQGALALAEKMFKPVGKIAVGDFEPYRMYPGQIDAGSFSDYGLCVYFQGPKSYTGEDIVEFQCHGGENVARGILKKTFELGARSATRGEFTKRAFLNGKLSLASAEGVADMINGESEAEVKAGFLLYSEKLTKKVTALQDDLTYLLAGIDVSVDYPEEDIEEQHVEEIKVDLLKIADRLDEILSAYSVGKKIKTGVTVAICGKPNTGKSSLLNKILGYEKAIVSSIAGTTRDAVEGVIEINGVKFNLYDTAGVRESGDVIETIGIERAEAIVKSADVVVFVTEGDEPGEEEKRALEMAEGKPLIRVLNKSDLWQDGKVVSKVAFDLKTSAVTGEGVEELKTMLYEISLGGERSEDAAFLIEERHHDALRRARESAGKAIRACGVEPLDLIGIDVKAIWDSLGEITGETATESIINEIFEKFCVGK